MRQDLTPETVRKLLNYDHETGKLFWRKRPRSMFPDLRACKIWNTKYAGKEAFTAIKGNGYRKGSIFHQSVLAHRVIWAIAYGEWPLSSIDHANGDPSDNRLCNLRSATMAQNTWNSRIRCTNRSGFKGVCWFRPKQRWRAEITVHGRKVHLGYFQTPESAHAAYCAASKRLHAEYGRTK